MLSRQALSSSSLSYQWTYDVFLSFRGEDTRDGFTGYLYNAFCDKGIHTFIDDEDLRKGDEITTSLLKAIEESRIAIIVFSKNYASSSYCLQELFHILHCVKGNGRLVWPIFYKVDPSDVRNHRGSYEEALAKHEERFNKDKIKKWRSVLTEAANLSGSHYTHGYEYGFVRKIVEDVCKKINRCFLDVANYPIGLEFRVQEVTSLLDIRSDKGTYMVGIYGIGGIGKTTIASAVYNFIADQFEGHCFLANIRENSVKHGLVHLQETLLFELIEEKNIKLGNVKRGITVIKRRLHGKKVLLILDDVDKLEHLQAIAGKPDWFGSGSRIIVTTRDKHLLKVHGVEKLYEAKGLDDDEATELLTWNAFKSIRVDPSYKDILKRAILYCNGLPLALEIVGSNLFSKPLEEWQSALDSYERIPDENIQDILKKSYDDLKGNEKDIFLDIACCFKGYDLKYAKDIILNGRGFSPEYGIGVLINKSLIKVDQCEIVRMHDLIEDMGREIVRQESLAEPGRRSRVWFHEDILQVIDENKGTDKIEVMKLRLPRAKQVHWNGSEFEKMKNLKILIIENAYFSKGPEHLPKSLRVLKWEEYPSPSLPPTYDPRKLVMLDLSLSCFKFNKQPVTFESLSELRLMGCDFITIVPDISKAVKLRKLILEDCKNLVEVHDSLGFCDKLEWLSLKRCSKLSFLPPFAKLTSLQNLSLDGCESLRIFPNIIEPMEHLRDLVCHYIGIEELPFSFSNLIGLESIVLSGCNLGMLHQLWFFMLKLPNLKRLVANKCGRNACLTALNSDVEQERVTSAMSSSIIDVQFISCEMPNQLVASYIQSLPNLQFLSLAQSDLTILPVCLGECRFLRSLVLDHCSYLQEIRRVPPNIKYLSAINCISLTYQSQCRLLSQELHQGGETEAFVPGFRIPKWFDHFCRGSTLSFWFHEKFPSMALCVVLVLDQLHLFSKSMFNLLINGIQCLHFSLNASPETETEHVFLFDLQLNFDKGEMERIYIGDGWNHAEISYTQPLKGDFKHCQMQEKGIIKWTGAHIYRRKTSMHNIRFTNFKSPNRITDDYFLNCYKGLDLNCHPLQRKRKLDDFLNCNKGLDIVPNTLQQPQVLQRCDGSHSESIYERLWKEISSMEAPPKIKMLMCNICDDALPTYEYLFRKKLVDSPLCPICEREPETIQHVFLICPWTRPLWFGSNVQWSVEVDSMHSFPIWLYQKLEEIKRVYPNAKQVSSLVMSICWAIWKGRNEFVLGDQPLDPLSALMNMSRDSAS